MESRSGRLRVKCEIIFYLPKLINDFDELVFEIKRLRNKIKLK